MAQTIQRSFTGGELAPALRSRADVIKYTTGLALCENMFVRPQGGVYSRPGTKFICELSDSSTPGRLIPFEFNTEQTYILVFENLKMRVIKDGGVVQSGGVDYVLTTPYTSSDLARLQFTQSADVMTIVHPDYDPRNLSRTGDASWSLDTISFSPTVPIPNWASAIVANIIYTAQTNPCEVIFDAAHGLSTGNTVTIDGVSGMIQLNGNNYVITVTAADRITLDGENATGYTAYSSVSITAATKSNPCVITTSAFHGLTTGDKVYIDQVAGMTELNDIVYTVTVLTPTTFELDGIDSTSFGAYISGGIVAAVSGTVTRGTLSKTGSGFGTYFKNYSYVITAVDDDGVESLASAEGTIYCESLSTTGGVRLTWDAVAGAAYYRVYKDPSDGTGVYGWIGDSKNLQFIDFNIAPITSDAPPEDRDPFAGVNNKPSTVAYYQQRRIYANTNNEPQTTFTSQVGVYNSMRTSAPARDGDAITFTINSKQVNEIRHLVELDLLIILTSGGEYRVTEGQNEVLTPSTAGVRKQSNNGASWVNPAVIDDTVIYVQEKGGRLRDLNYEFVDDRYKGSDLSIMAEHLFSDHTIDEMAFSKEPYGILWCIRSDGRLLGLTYQREHEVWAWHQHYSETSSGESDFESVAVINEDGRDVPYFIVERTINGSVVRYVERMEKRIVTAPEDVWFVDSGLQYSGIAATVISGLDHLEGETVAVVADGNVVSGLTVSGGQITLPRASSKVTVGLSYTCAIETLDVDVNSMVDTLKGKSVSVSRVMLEVQDTRGIWVGPKGDDDSTGTMYEVKPRYNSDAYGAIQLFTGKEQIHIDPQWSYGGGIRIEQRSPMPQTILSVIPEIDVS